MKKSIFTAIASVLITLSAGAQNKSIVVANPSVSGLYATPEIAAKVLRLETVKLEQYNVYDEFDMQDAYAADSSLAKECFSRTCLAKLGEALNVDYALSGTLDKLGNKIVVTLKIIDVKNNTLYKSKVREFDDQEAELQRMVGIVLQEMHNMEIDKTLNDRLKFNDELVTSNNVGKINNSGPRVGGALMTGTVAEFATRRESQGGLDIQPVVSMIGYQLEAQYVGTENFSALGEIIFNVAGLEQGQFIPTITLLNGFRFGKAGWEFAFGPGFGLKKTTDGFFDTEGEFGEVNKYYSRNDWTQEHSEANNWARMEDVTTNGYEYTEQADTRGKLKVSTSFLMAFGRTFRAGSLNIPVNVFYSARKRGGFAGMSVGFNIQKTKKPINSNQR